ncbi:MAG: oligopeptidase B, partial [Actinomycetes bacterium]
MHHSAADSPDSTDVPAPHAPTVPVPGRTLHGEPWEDDYAWLRNVDDPLTQRYLGDERAFYEARTAHTRSLQQTMFEEMVSRTVPSDRSVSWSRGGLVYYTCTAAGKEYQQLFRLGAEDSPAELVLDENDLADGSPYFALGLREPSPDGGVVAYSVDLAGDEVFELRFRDTVAGKDLPETVARSYYGGAWSADSQTFFYVVHDKAYRPHQVWRHELGTDPADDALVLQEDDDRFEVYCEGSRSGAYVVIRIQSKDTSEVWLVPTDRPGAPARVVQPRVPGLLYSVALEPRPDGDVLLVVTDDAATEFRILQAPVAEPGRAGSTELIGEDQA